MTEQQEEIIPEIDHKKKSTRRKVYQFLFTLYGINTEKIDAKYSLCNKITEKTFEKLQPKLIFMLHRNYFLNSNKEDLYKNIRQLFYQLMSIKLPKIECSL